MTFPNPKWNDAISTVLDNSAAVDKGGGEVGLPITGHSFQAEQIVILAGTVNYDGSYVINSKTADEIVITATYEAETFTGAETIDFNRQPIVKADFRALEAEIQGQPLIRMQPPLVWVDTATVRVEATADCPASMAFTGFPNILNPYCQADGGLTDSKIRTVTANVDCDIGADGLYGTTQTEKVSQWYTIFAVAADTVTDYDLKAMPLMRVKSQTGQAIKTGTLATPASGIDYGFTEDDLIGGKVYFLTGTSKGLMRSISANDVDTDTRITYTGDALTVAAGDWFVVLPPTNFRYVGCCFNYVDSNIQKFYQRGNLIAADLLYGLDPPSGTPTEDIRCGPPWAIALGVAGDATMTMGHPDATSCVIPFGSGVDLTFAEVPIKECKYRGAGSNPAYVSYYKNPPGSGF